MLDCTKALVEVCRDVYGFNDSEIMEVFHATAKAIEIAAHEIGQMSQDEFDAAVSEAKAKKATKAA